jgi:hypothetical protein
VDGGLPDLFEFLAQLGEGRHLLDADIFLRRRRSCN